jgi:phage anti-repressor protein
MATTIDIVALIERAPITRLSDTYQHKLLGKIQRDFTEDDQHMFVTSYYCFLNYHPTNDYVIDLDNVWKWLGFSTKQKARMLLEKHFILDKDYKNLLNLSDMQDSDQHGGHNKLTFLLNLQTFKRFCMKAGTKKADQIHEYYLKMEEMLHETIQEETDELRSQLKKQQNITYIEKNHAHQQALLGQFPKNSQCIYYGVMSNTLTDHPTESLIKFGHSNDLPTRVQTHQRTFANFCLVNVFRVENRTRIENAIKCHPILKNHRRILTIEDTNYTEILGGIAPDALDQIIQDIIAEIEYSPENYSKLWDKYQKMETAHKKLRIREKDLSTELYRVKREFNEYVRKSRREPETEPVPEIDPTPSSTTTFLNRTCVRRFNRDKTDKKYHINGRIYKELYGTREEVWNYDAYHTRGNLTRDYFIVGRDGIIVSKNKQASCKENMRSICLPRKTTTNEIVLDSTE